MYGMANEDYNYSKIHANYLPSKTVEQVASLISHWSISRISPHFFLQIRNRYSNLISKPASDNPIAHTNSVDVRRAVLCMQKKNVGVELIGFYCSSLRLLTSRNGG